MNEILKIFVLLGVVLFILAGVATLLFLFSGIFVSGDTVAVIDMSGDIAENGQISATLMHAMFKDAADDPSVVAVILRINSGGGAVVETKEIARSLSALSKEKPVVAYISEIGASGAYYVAAYADHIVADEDSLVGGIGVTSTYTSYQKLLEDKLGINTTVLKSGKFKDIGSPYRQMTEEEKQDLQAIIDTVHNEFMDVIISNRGLTRQAISEVNTSNIFLGSKALRLGLVDYNGGFDTALAIARQVSKSPNAEPKYISSSDYQGADLYYSIGRGMGDALASKIDLSKGQLEFK